ncbi:MAG: L-seryl-tRNA(Sec) selenium transferase, partial [Planctomycetota bacterium]
MTASLDPKVLQNLRALPAVDSLLRAGALTALEDTSPRSSIVASIREVLAEARAAVRAGQEPPLPDQIAERAAARVVERDRLGTGVAINATGVVLHTGLGRAPLAPAAQEAVHRVAAGYSLLEIDRHSGARGVREAVVAKRICGLTGGESATVVNNCAAACLLMLAALAEGREVIVARGQLVEIGGSFRI